MRNFFGLLFSHQNSGFKLEVILEHLSITFLCGRCSSKHFTYIDLLSAHNDQIGYYYYPHPIVQMKKSKHREVKQVAKDHTVNEV